LVAVGSYDWVCPPVASRALAAGMPAASLVEFSEAGHFAFSEVPGAFQGAVRAFLEDTLELDAASGTVAVL
jgi:proline iminopeptidase